MQGHKLTAEEVFRAAWGFSKAVDVLAEHGCGKCATAEVIDEALCLELYFKCLLLLETGSWPKAHLLQQLFGLLSQDSKDRVERYYNEDLGEFRGVTVEKGGKTYTSDLKSVLQDTGNSFVEWRYFFEEGMDPKPVSGWQSLRAALRRRLLELQPGWAKHL